MNLLKPVAEQSSLRAFAKLLEAEVISSLARKKTDRDHNQDQDRSIELREKRKKLAEQARAFARHATLEVGEQIRRHNKLHDGTGEQSSSGILETQRDAVGRKAALQEHYVEVLYEEEHVSYLDTHMAVARIRCDYAGTEDWALAEVFFVRLLKNEGFSAEYIKQRTRLIAEDLSRSTQMLIPDVVVKRVVDLELPEEDAGSLVRQLVWVVTVEHDMFHFYAENLYLFLVAAFVGLLRHYQGNIRKVKRLLGMSSDTDQDACRALDEALHVWQEWKMPEKVGTLIREVYLSDVIASKKVKTLKKLFESSIFEEAYRRFGSDDPGKVEEIIGCSHRSYERWLQRRGCL